MADTSTKKDGRGRARGRRPRRLGLWTVIVLLVLLASFVGMLEITRTRLGGQELRLDTFVDLAERGRVDKARILDQDAAVVGTYTDEDGTTHPYFVEYLQTGVRERLVDIVIENRIPTTVDRQFLKGLRTPVTAFIGVLMLVAVFGYLAASYRYGTGLFGVTSGARRAEAGPGDVGFEQVAGQDAAVAEVRELADFLRDPDRFVQLGATIPRGVLLYGPPGCGKTLTAKALASEAGAAFYSISGSDFVELYVGVGAARVRDLFAQAREDTPAIVFIDELDAIGRRRSSGGTAAQGSSQEQGQALNQILAEMDGFDPSSGIIVLAATNRPDVLDPALVRPGRFDRTIGFERPDEAGRLDVLRVHAGRTRLAGDVDLAALAAQAHGLSGADLANVMNEAALLAGRAGKAHVEQADLRAALQRIVEAPERQRRLSQSDRTVGHRFAFGPEDDRVTFADVAGVDEVVDELSEIRAYLTEPERFAAMGARVPRGILMDGPPGVGKTLLARALAGEAHATFLYAAATEFVEVYVGEGAGRVRDLFSEARALAPAIVFLDEIDAVGARRGAGSQDGGREREQTLNQILTELDGFEARSGVIVVAATNRPDILDPALVRPGRFDRHVTISLPSRERRLQILGLHAAGMPLTDDVDLEALAAMTQGFSGADLANVLNEAGLLAARRSLDRVPMAVVEEALERGLLGVAPTSERMDERERAMVAYHEAGHALVGRLLAAAPVPHRLSIIPRGPALGATWSLEDRDRVVHARSALFERMAGMLAGRAAEELVFGEPSSGAVDDLRRANQLARQMVTAMGMSEQLGALSLDGTGPDGRAATYSGDTVRTVDAEIRRLVDDAYGHARQSLVGAREALDTVAEALLEREILTREEFEELCEQAGASPPTPVA